MSQLSAPITRCLQCGTADFIRGELGIHRTTFCPQNQFCMLGYPVQPWLCLTCGRIELYLSQPDCDDIRARHATKTVP